MSAPTFASAAHLCALTLDVESGKIKIERYIAVDDVGRIINKAIVDGQIEGGVIHGVGGSLYEQMVFNEEGALLTSNLVDYLIPTSLDSPNIELFHVETPSTITLNGAKGAGEGGTIAAYPAVINAVNDALAQLDPKLKLNMVPATPESVVATIKKISEGPNPKICNLENLKHHHEISGYIGSFRFFRSNEFQFPEGGTSSCPHVGFTLVKMNSRSQCSSRIRKVLRRINF